MYVYVYVCAFVSVVYILGSLSERTLNHRLYINMYVSMYVYVCVYVGVPVRIYRRT